MYKVEANWAVGKPPHFKPAHVFYVNGAPVGTRVADVIKAIQGPPRDLIVDTCRAVKVDPYDVTLTLTPCAGGWVAA